MTLLSVLPNWAELLPMCAAVTGVFLESQPPFLFPSEENQKESKLSGHMVLRS